MQTPRYTRIVMSPAQWRNKHRVIYDLVPWVTYGEATRFYPCTAAIKSHRGSSWNFLHCWKFQRASRPWQYSRSTTKESPLRIGLALSSQVFTMVLMKYPKHKAWGWEIQWWYWTIIPTTLLHIQKRRNHMSITRPTPTTLTYLQCQTPTTATS